MGTVRQHHKSKKNRYNLIIVPDEDASKAKNFHLALWQIVSLLSLLAVISIIFIFLILNYTPLGQVFPISNPVLENKYSKELISLNHRMMNLMENLIELRAYNVKLRRALGENVILSDSGEIKITSKNYEIGKNSVGKEDQKDERISYPINLGYQINKVRSVNLSSNAQSTVAFPAILPAEGYVTRGFEPDQNHIGLDIAGKTGTVIIAAAEGSIVFSGWTYNDGYILILSHDNGFMTIYKHNQSLLKSVGTFVRRGEPIATLGDSGITSSGPHLHFEIWRDGLPVDPSAYLINL